ncbi:hypothetical protein [uncultured Winogradskyella sp.]|uniref:hypothetical protein n=1 Tax=uncultured Winogradskyella sp. TaxID=395353 RepID=UPI00261A1203|nr:hypothetical protein [uncultured Winogradskyella sp.]
MKKSILILAIGLITFNMSFAQDWDRYKSEDLAFIANFPSEPERSQQKINTALGDLDMHMVMYSPTVLADYNAVYSVIRSDYPEEQFKDVDSDYTDSILDGAVEGAVSNVKGTLLYDKRIVLNGYPGREIKIEISVGYIYVNAYLVDNVMFITQVVCLIDNDNNESIKRFLNSFDILKVK